MVQFFDKLSLSARIIMISTMAFQMSAIAQEGSSAPVTLTTTPQIDNPNCQLIMAGHHYAVKNLNKNFTTYKTPPRVLSPCNVPYKLSSVDKIFTLQSGIDSYYFKWDNWTFGKEKGDGGVDVTGAPSKQLVEGANSVLVNVNPGSHLWLSIAIPAEGYMTFNWDNIGGSTTSMLRFTVNKQEITAAQKVFSPLLRPGDLVTIELINKGATPEKMEISNFNFYTNSNQLIKRTWTAVDLTGNRNSFDQFIAIERPAIQQVFFPVHLNELRAPVLETGTSIPPSVTGVPYFDEDGNPETPYDQVLTTELKEGFEVVWIDEIDRENERLRILRHWTVKDVYLGNSITKTQIIKIAPESFSEKEIAGSTSAIENFRTKHTGKTESVSKEKRLAINTADRQ